MIDPGWTKGSYPLTRPKGSPVNVLVPGTAGHPQRSPVDVGHLVYILLLWLTGAWMQYFISTSFEAFLRLLWKREKKEACLWVFLNIIISTVDFLTGVGEDMNKLIKSRIIYFTVMQLLKAGNDIAYIRYCLYLSHSEDRGSRTFKSVLYRKIPKNVQSIYRQLPWFFCTGVIGKDAVFTKSMYVQR